MLGIGFAILAAAGFGFNTASIRRGVLSASSSQGLYYTVLLALPLFFLAALISGQLFEYDAFSTRDIIVLNIAGVVHIFIGRYCNIRAIDAIGANRAGPLVGMSTLVSVIVAVLFLSEEMTWIKVGGILLMMAGPTLVVRGNRKEDRAKRNAPVPVAITPQTSTTETFSPSTLTTTGAEKKLPPMPVVRMREGYFWGVMAAAAWGVGPVLMRSGMGDSGLGILGGMTAYFAPSALLILGFFIPGVFRQTMSIDPSAQKWFLLSTANSFTANVFRFMALSLAPVSVVIPLVRTGVIFAIFFNLAINRRTESFDPMVIVGILVSVAGAIVLVAL
jgi:drug/metabolite transporter (DMT)-like permease